ncbi:TPA: type 1 fimbrial protein [Klebsiella quasipneumoniae subsp. similipneumoniae]|nr:type 1 fimbrial protein [Klebsiella quasipneumoniae subsp. similipneumoniae]
MLNIAKKNNFTAGTLFGLALYFSSGQSEVHAKCVSPAPPPPQITIPLPVSNMYISPNVNNNNILLSFLRFGQATHVECATTLYWVHKVENTSGTTGVFIDGSPVYKTNIEGLGVYYRRTNSNGLIIERTTLPRIEMGLVKLTNSTIGGVLDAASLPSISFYATESSSGAFDSSALQLTKMSLSGRIHYVVPTCQAEDKNVWLGEYNASSFTNNSVTPWVDAGIVMTCDSQFRNAYTDVWEIYSLPHNVTTTTRPDHYYSVSLESVNEFIDRSRGIMALDNGGATGVGVQISRSQSEQSWSSMTWIDEHKSTTNTFKVPLYARYIQTGNSVTPGQANSKLLYTIEYK